jgi:hypothetical protein
MRRSDFSPGGRAQPRRPSLERRGIALPARHRNLYDGSGVARVPRHPKGGSQRGCRRSYWGLRQCSAARPMPAEMLPTYIRVGSSLPSASMLKSVFNLRRTASRRASA